MATSRAGTTPAPSATAGAGAYPAARTGAATARTGGRTQQGTVATSSTRVIQPTSVQSPSRRAPAARSRASAPAASSPSRARVNYRQPRSRTTPAPSGNYQPVILAEFVGVILAIALSPVAKGESTQGVSPYGGGDMVKLAAATLLFVIIGFVSTASQGAARVAAWFGGLTLIAVGLAEGAAVSKEIGLFTGNLAAAAQGQPSGGSALSQGQIQAGELQALGQQEAISQGQGAGATIWQTVINAFAKIGPQGVPVSLTGQGKPL